MMGMLPIYKCYTCGATWTPRVEQPKKCPRCRSILWNVKKDDETKKPSQ